MTRICAALSALLLIVPAARAQTPQGAVTVVPGPQYDASGFARFFLGDGWRSLWLTPVEVPVLDVGTFEGGLTPERQGGGNQSITLHFVDAQGTGWVFRSIDKYPQQALPRELDGSFLGSLVEDQISALNPGAHFVMPRLLREAGILHITPALYVMPDDARLGEYRETFAGMLGALELKPNEGEDDTPGFAGSRKIKDSDAFLDDLEESAGYRLDAQEYLLARLIDMWVGDPDRGTDQWRWARFGAEGDQVYRPIPRDRDWAFVRAGGFLTARFRSFYPKLMEFGPRPPGIERLTYSSHVLDRRLLTGLQRADFERAAQSLQRMMTDDVIAEAVSSMPREMVPVAGDDLRRNLLVRRAALPAIARDFYEWLASDVDVRATDERDYAYVERREDGTVRVMVAPLAADIAGTDGNAAPAAAWYDRTFLPDETDEIRVYLHGDADRAFVTGTDRGSIKVRVIGGGGDDVLEDATGTARFYDHRGDNEFRGGASHDTKDWEAPPAPEGLRYGKAWAPDWGGDRTLFSPVVSYGEGAGIIIGGGPRFETYGFRRLPHRSGLGIDVLHGTRSGGWGVAIAADHVRENSRLALTLDARAVEFDAFRFYGFGNESGELGDEASLVMQDRVTAFPALTWQLGPQPGRESDDEDGEDDQGRVGAADAVFQVDRPAGLAGTLSIGPLAQWTRMRVPSGNPLPAGRADGFGQVGAQAVLQLERTDRDAVPRRGFRLSAQGAAFPAAWDATDAFGRARAQLSGYVPLLGETHLALRVGGEAALGEFPVFEAASVGGGETLRGYRFRRYSGDRASWGGVELRVPIDTVNVIVNGELGIFGLADAARVWVDGESPGGWHTGFGGGLWFSAFDKALSVAWASGDQTDGRFYIWQGLPF